MTAKRILLVEDEQELRDLLATGLRHAGYLVDLAVTTAEAQLLMQAQPYALVIADWSLPDGNGIDLADRALERGAKSLIISGYLFGLPAGATRRHVLLALCGCEPLVSGVEPGCAASLLTCERRKSTGSSSSVTSATPTAMTTTRCSLPCTVS